MVRERVLIPRLNELADYRLVRIEPATLGRIAQQAWEVPARFAERWTALHYDDAVVAQNHWEQVVQRILGRAAAVGTTYDRSTMRRAVTAAITVLEHPELAGTCFIGKAEEHRPPAPVRVQVVETSQAQLVEGDSR